MDVEPGATPLTEFQFEEGSKRLNFVETVDVVEGVKCEVYSVQGDTSKDLGIIKIQLGHSTPLQKILEGERTIEGFVSGKGKLKITRANGEEEVHPVDDKNEQKFSINVGIGDTMQWHADEGSSLVAFEICVPPYEEGRFKNL